MVSQRCTVYTIYTSWHTWRIDGRNKWRSIRSLCVLAAEVAMVDSGLMCSCGLSHLPWHQDYTASLIQTKSDFISVSCWTEQESSITFQSHWLTWVDRHRPLELMPAGYLRQLAHTLNCDPSTGASYKQSTGTTCEGYPTSTVTLLFFLLFLHFKGSTLRFCVHHW